MDRRQESGVSGSAQAAPEVRLRGLIHAAERLAGIAGVVSLENASTRSTIRPTFDASVGRRVLEKYFLCWHKPPSR
jgi:hypothetical protein